MKFWYVILICMLTITSYATEKTLVQLEPYSEHSGNVWTIRRFPVSEISKPHAKIHTNNVTVKWNIAKGRLRITCGGLCDTTERYMVRLFDKDSLRIDFVAYDLEVDKVYADSEYIVPKSVRGEIALMELTLLDNDDGNTFEAFRGEVLCYDGYILTDTIESEGTVKGSKKLDKYKIYGHSLTDFLVYDWVSHSGTDNWYNNGFYSTCIKEQINENAPTEYSYSSDETDNDYTPDGGWYSDKTDCPPSWQDSNGNCKKGW